MRLGLGLGLALQSLGGSVAGPGLKTVYPGASSSLNIFYVMTDLPGTGQAIAFSLRRNTTDDGTLQPAWRKAETKTVHNQLANPQSAAVVHFIESNGSQDYAFKIDGVVYGGADAFIGEIHGDETLVSVAVTVDGVVVDPATITAPGITGRVVEIQRETTINAATLTGDPTVSSLQTIRYDEDGVVAISGSINGNGLSIEEGWLNMAMCTPSFNSVQYGPDKNTLTSASLSIGDLTIPTNTRYVKFKDPDGYFMEVEFTQSIAVASAYIARTTNFCKLYPRLTSATSGATISLGAATYAQTARYGREWTYPGYAPWTANFAVNLGGFYGSKTGGTITGTNPYASTSYVSVSGSTLTFGPADAISFSGRWTQSLAKALGEPLIIGRQYKIRFRALGYSDGATRAVAHTHGQLYFGVISHNSGGSSPALVPWATLAASPTGFVNEGGGYYSVTITAAQEDYWFGFRWESGTAGRLADVTNLTAEKLPA